MSSTRTLFALALVALVALAGACNRNEAPAGGGTQQAPPATPPAQGMPPASGSQELPPGHPPISGAASTEIVPPAPGTGSGDTGMTWAVPSGWVSETPDSQMRKAQYKVPGPGGDAECNVFYFGPGQGGDAEMNADRWAGQFNAPDGGPADKKMATRKVGDLPVLTVEVRGTYRVTSMMGPPGPPKPGYMLLGAVAEGPDANWFFKLTGPAATVEAQRAAFDQMIGSIKKGS